jgi:hypothetical protein
MIVTVAVDLAWIGLPVRQQIVQGAERAQGSSHAPGKKTQGWVAAHGKAFARLSVGVFPGGKVQGRQTTRRQPMCLAHPE